MLCWALAVPAILPAVSAGELHPRRVILPLDPPARMRPYGPGNHRATRGPGRPRRRPAKLHADNGYDYPTCRQALRRRGIIPRVARRGVESSQRLGHHRWEVERSLAWLLANRRLTVRYGGSADLSEAFSIWPAR